MAQNEDYSENELPPPVGWFFIETREWHFENEGRSVGYGSRSVFFFVVLVVR